jgi:hypothetical protein
MTRNVSHGLSDRFHFCLLELNVYDARSAQAAMPVAAASPASAIDASLRTAAS